MKGIVTVFILMSVIDGVLNFNFDSLKEILDHSYSRNEEIWNESEGVIANGLKNEFVNFLKNEKIDANVSEVLVEGSEDSFEIKRVVVSGKDADAAKNLLAGRYQIGLSYIEVKNG